MKPLIAFLVMGYILLFALAVKSPHQVAAKPSMNGASIPGCDGGGCHTLKRGTVTAQYIGNMRIRLTLSGTTSKAAADVVVRRFVFLNKLQDLYIKSAIF
jgi:hypothetical protein